MAEINKTLNTGIVGWGLAGRYFHAPFILNTAGLNLVAGVTHRTIEQDLFRGVEAYASLEEMLNKQSLDLVIVASPDHLHLEQSILALNAGCHVVLEKPIVTSLNDFQILKQAVENSSRLLIPFQNRRWDGDFRTVQDILNTGDLGKIYYYAASWPRYRPKIKDRMGSWREDPEQFAGIMLDLGAHLVDQVVHLFGKPESVLAHNGANRPGSIGEDWFRIQLFYPEALRVVLEVDSLNPMPVPRFHVRGTSGTFEKFGLDMQEALLVKGGMPGKAGELWGREPHENWGRVIKADVDGNISEKTVETIAGDYGLFYRAVYEAIAHGEAPPVSLEDIEIQLGILAAAKQSIQMHQVVPLDDFLAI